MAYSSGSIVVIGDATANHAACAGILEITTSTDPQRSLVTPTLRAVPPSQRQREEERT